MARLVYMSITSLDGYVSDPTGNFDWGTPDPEVHRFVNDLERPVGTYLYGRRMYEAMRYWESAGDLPDPPDYVRDFTDIWQGADKVVYSRTLSDLSSPNARLEPSFDADAVRALKATSERDLSVGGPELASQAIRSGLVDEYQLFVSPVVVGGGHPFLPTDIRLDLELQEVRRFGNGVVFLRYRTRT